MEDNLGFEMPSKKSKKHPPTINKQTKDKYAVCKSCAFEYKRKVTKSFDEPHHPQSEKKRKLVDLLGGKCEICGYDKSIAALSFHHKDRKHKKFAISTYLNLPLEDLILEAKKCSLICLNCHAELHYGNKQPIENNSKTDVDIK
jgi:hypothetical protein